MIKTVFDIRLISKEDRFCASNEIKEGKIFIEIYLKIFKFRKYVSYKKVIKELVKYNLAELICALTRVLDEDLRPLCEIEKTDKYPCICTNIAKKLLPK